MALKKKRIFYLCDGTGCLDADCKAKYDREHPINFRTGYINECRHTTNKTCALNGPIKGPFNFWKRFKICFRPWIHFIEKEKYDA